MENTTIAYGKAVAILAEACKGSKDTNVLAAIAAIALGRPRGVRKEHPILAMFVKVGDTVHEDDIYKAHKMGRKDVHWAIADAIKEGDKTSRKWIALNEATGLYKLYGIGADKPGDGYNGYVPKAER